MPRHKKNNSKEETKQEDASEIDENDQTIKMPELKRLPSVAKPKLIDADQPLTTESEKKPTEKENKNKWIEYVQQYRVKHPDKKYSEALKICSEKYKKKDKK